MTNLVIITGTVVRKPRPRPMGRKTMIGFAIAQDRRYYKDGEERTFTSYFDCEAWDGPVPEMREGETWTVRGRLREDRWQSDGTWKIRMKVIVEEVRAGHWNVSSDEMAPVA